MTKWGEWREFTPDENAQWEADAADPDSGYLVVSVVHRPKEDRRIFGPLLACGQTHRNDAWWVPGRIVRAEGYSRCRRPGCWGGDA